MVWVTLARAGVAQTRALASRTRSWLAPAASGVSQTAAVGISIAVGAAQVWGGSAKARGGVSPTRAARASECDLTPEVT